MPRLLGVLAGRTAQVLNVLAAGEKVGLDHKVAESYTRLLEAVLSRSVGPLSKIAKMCL